MKRRSFLLRAAGLTAVLGGGYWLRNNVLWRKPDLVFGAEGSGWLDYQVVRANVPTAKVQIAGRTVTALIDTGAEHSLIGHSLADELGLGDRFDMPITIYGADGQAQKGRGVSLDLTVGGLKIERLRAALLDLGPLASHPDLNIGVVLGQDLFNQAILELDHPGRRVRLVDPDTYVVAPKLRPVEVRKKGTALMTEVTLEGAVFEVLIDTGYSGLVTLDHAEVEAAGLLKDRPTETVESVVVGGTADARAIRLKTISFGDRLWRDGQVMFHAKPRPLTGGAALLGMEAFEGRQVVLDLGQGRLFQSGELDLKLG